MKLFEIKRMHNEVDIIICNHKFFEVKFKNGIGNVFFKNHKIFSYIDVLSYGIIDFMTLPKTEVLEADDVPENQKITLIYSVYYQHGDFTDFYKVLDIYNNYNNEIKKNLEIIIVDDGSKFPLKLPKNINLNITLLRIKKDIAWNSCGARNLGVCYATTKKILCMDIDFIIKEDTLNSLIKSKINDNEYIVFNAINYELNNGCEFVPPNLFATLKSTFLKYNGYDEDIAGFYGDDVFFRKYLCRHNVKFTRYGTIITEGDRYNSREHHLSRKLSKVKKYMKKKKEHTCKMLNFPWEFVEEKIYIDN